MSGDSRVSLGTGGLGGKAVGGAVVDAHSVKAGDFSEARHIDGDEVFLTKAGAAALDAFTKLEGVSVTTERDPESFLSALRTSPREALISLLVSQQHSGSTR